MVVVVALLTAVCAAGNDGRTGMGLCETGTIPRRFINVQSTVGHGRSALIAFQFGFGSSHFGSSIRTGGIVVLWSSSSSVTG